MASSQAPRRETFSISMPAEDAAELRAQASRAGVTISALLRDDWAERSRQRAAQEELAEYGDLDYSAELVKVRSDLELPG